MAFRQGIYSVQNKDKYIGRLDDNHPRFLSSYEYHVFRFLDLHKSVIRWGSECVVVRYRNPAKLDTQGNPRICRYLVDLYVEYVNNKGEKVKELIEIKPSKDLKKPTKRGRKRQDVYLREQLTYVQNKAKWAAATAYAKQHGLQFRIITEKSIFAT